MPPKAAFRSPAGAGFAGHRASRGAQGRGAGAARAKAKARGRAGRRRPATRGEEEQQEEDERLGVGGDSERGEVVDAYKLPLEVWKIGAGMRVAVTKAICILGRGGAGGRLSGHPLLSLPRTIVW